MKKSCCVITAAGLSSRMGNFKPLLPINDQPAIVHLISTMRRAGVDHCMIVTGHRAKELISVCSKLSQVSFVHNPNYASTEMFESVRIGFQSVEKTYSRILYTPVDVPLIPVSVVKELLLRKEPLLYPSYHFKKGHPVALDAGLLPQILSYRGKDGLRGALASLSVPPSFLETDHPGVLMDMNTQDDYRKILHTADTFSNRI